MSSLKYEIRNKKNEAAHQNKPSACTTRKMTDAEWEKYGPKNTQKKKGVHIKGACGWGHQMIKRGVFYQ